MARYHSGVAPRETGHVTLARAAPHVIEISLYGVVDEEAIAAIDTEAPEAADAIALLLDVSALTQIAPAGRAACAALLRAAVARGVVRGVCVAPFPSQRATAAAIAFVAALPLEFHVHRKDAARALGIVALP